MKKLIRKLRRDTSGAVAIPRGARARLVASPTNNGKDTVLDLRSVTVAGQTWTQQSLFQRNVGAGDDMYTAFPPHKVIGNIYYVGTKSLAVYLIVTPAGNILVNKQGDLVLLVGFGAGMTAASALTRWGGA